jgi:hypothetical protein
LDGAFEFEATCFHEAGHAVVGYMVGFGLSSVSVTVECGPLAEGSEQLGYRFPGVYMNAKRQTARAAKEIRERGYCWAALANGVMSCAGPAAELRYLTHQGMPRRLLWATIWDHEAVDRTAKYLESGGSGRFRSRDRFAFRRLAWREAQKLIHREEVWTAIADLAFALHDGMEGMEWPDEIGSTTSMLPGATARSIIRRAGVQRLSC